MFLQWGQISLARMLRKRNRKRAQHCELAQVRVCLEIRIRVRRIVYLKFDHLRENHKKGTQYQNYIVNHLRIFVVAKQLTYADWELCNFRFYRIKENSIYCNVYYVITLLLKCIRYRNNTFSSM